MTGISPKVLRIRLLAMMLSITATAIGITTMAVGSFSAALMRGASERQLAAAVYLVRTAYWLHAAALVGGKCPATFLHRGWARLPG